MVVATLIRHSYLLNACPELKVAFWNKVLASQMIRHEWNEDTGRIIHPSFFDATRFPRVVIKLSQIAADSLWIDALVDFLTQEPTEGAGTALFDALHVPRRIPVTLCVDVYKPGVKQLSLLQNAFERSSQHAGRPFLIAKLEFQSHPSTAGVQALAEIVKSSRVYGLCAVKATGTSALECEPPVYGCAVQTLLQAVFQTTELSIQRNGKLRTIGGASLKNFSFNKSAVSVPRIAAICSALRYGCAVETLSLDLELERGAALGGQEECWKWLAFGLFYPRSRRLGGSFKLRTLNFALSKNSLTSGDVKAFKNALLNPVKHLARYQHARNEPAAEFVFCALQSGCKIFADSDYRSSLLKLGNETELEALCVDEHSVCVVVPGHGLGWVRTDQVVCLLRDGLDECAPNAMYDLEIHQVDNHARAVSEVSSFLKIVGARLTSFLLSCYIAIRSLLPSVLKHCVNLKHLSLQGCDLHNYDLVCLFKALRGELGARLLSLKLGYNKIDDVTFGRLAAFLSDKNRIPVLEQLSLIIDPPQRISLRQLRKALKVNKTLHTLELMQPKPYENHNEYHEVEEFNHVDFELTLEDRDKLDLKCQNELLRVSSLQRDSKVAFVSVLSHPSFEGTAQGWLDSWMVAQIFQFATSEVRRRILWFEDMTPIVDEDDFFNRPW